MPLPSRCVFTGCCSVPGLLHQLANAPAILIPKFAGSATNEFAVSQDSRNAPVGGCLASKKRNREPQVEQVPLHCAELADIDTTVAQNQDKRSTYSLPIDSPAQKSWNFSTHAQARNATTGLDTTHVNSFATHTK